jgi:hypothetical protein
MARCKLYEIPGPDAARTASAVRCHREATSQVTVDGKTVRACEKHRAKKWTPFMRDGWVYVVDLAAEPPKRSSKETKGGKHKRG